MKISVLSFTEQGRQLACKIKTSLFDLEVEIYQKPEKGIIFWSREQFEKKRALVFVGACGIAVRAIAPFVKDKLLDSPVLVLDEKGQYVIPILSGHMGGANKLANVLADRLGAVAVITTATDINQKFAVDMFAKKNCLNILNKDGIVKVSAKVLRGEKVTISIEDYEKMIKTDISQIPEEIEVISYPPKYNVDIIISANIKKSGEKAILKLKPKEYIIGIGCKKEKSKEEIESFIQKNLKKLELTVSDIAQIVSIERKKDEKGICEWADENRVPFLTFTIEELKSVEGDFHSSKFVEETVGVDNVCERAALFASKDKILILEKQMENGITLAIAKKKCQIEWGN